MFIGVVSHHLVLPPNIAFCRAYGSEQKALLGIIQFKTKTDACFWNPVKNGFDEDGENLMPQQRAEQRAARCQPRIDEALAGPPDACVHKLKQILEDQHETEGYHGRTWSYDVIRDDGKELSEFASEEPLTKSAAREL